MTTTQQEEVRAKRVEVCLGIKLLEILKKQRTSFIYTADGGKIITNPLLYHSLDEEALEIQRKISRKNKRKIIAECKERGIVIPNFRREGIVKI